MKRNRGSQGLILLCINDDKSYLACVFSSLCEACAKHTISDGSGSIGRSAACQGHYWNFHVLQLRWQRSAFCGCTPSRHNGQETLWQFLVLNWEADACDTATECQIRCQSKDCNVVIDFPVVKVRVLEDFVNCDDDAT